VGKVYPTALCGGMKKILEKTVVVLAIYNLSFIPFVIICALLGTDPSHVLVRYDPVLKVIAVFSCTVLFLWMALADGANSQIWYRIPPFTDLMRSGKCTRWLIVLLMISGSMLSFFAK
jgi:hypothetical protein